MEKVRVTDVFVLRTAVPPISAVEGKRVVRLRRLGKRIALGFEDGKWVVIHLMIAGRLQWSAAGEKPVARNALATFFFAVVVAAEQQVAIGGRCHRVRRRPARATP